jgi:ABC-type transport system involved in multi-copper enzyme maturation permease subunit
VNPIIRRELLEVLRTRKAMAAQVGLALVCALLVLLRWPTGDVADLSGARSLGVLRIFGYGLLAGIVLLVPAFPATALVREKIKGTLPLLLNSPMTPWSIYIGKLGGVLGFAAVLLAMTLPAAAACYALGGSASRGGIVTLYVILGIAAVQMSTLALLVSSRSSSSNGALLASYGLTLAVCVAGLGPHFMTRGSSGPVAEVFSWLRCLSPIPPVMETLGHGDVGTHGIADSASTPVRYAVLAGLFSIACALATLRRIDHRLVDRARPAGVMTQDRGKREQAVRRVLFLIDPQRRGGSMSLWVNPVLVKEFRTRRFGRLDWLLRLFFITVAASLALGCAAAVSARLWTLEWTGAVLVLFQVALLVLFSPSLAAGLVSAERESGTWQLLRITPLSAGAILRGKLMSVALPLVLLLCATLPGYLVLMMIEPTFMDRAQRVAACLVLTAVFAVLLSAAVSTLFRSTAAATVTSYALLLALCGLPLLVWLGQDAPFGHATVEAVLSIDPVAAALQASAMPGFADYELLPANWWIIGGACVGLLVFLRFRIWQLSRPD